jgi:hypothetical protein
VGWRDWHGLQEHVKRTAFRHKFVTPSDYPRGSDDEPEPKHPPVDTDFWVCFSAPVKVASLTPDVISITLVDQDSDDRGVAIRIPIERLWIQEPMTGDPPYTTRSFRPMVSWQYWDGEIKRGASSKLNFINLAEIRIYADSIIDWFGQAVDGNAIGRRLPSGNGTPGGDFVSRFTIDPNGTYPPPSPPGGAAAASVTSS